VFHAGFLPRALGGWLPRLTGVTAVSQGA